MTRLPLLALLAACADPPASGPQLERAEPPYGPLIGGTTITLHGANFDPTARVLVGGREAPLAFARTASELDVVIPPGDAPGDAELIVLAAHGTAIEPAMFRYSAPPTVLALSPNSIPYDAGTTQVTLEGTGFADDGAGEPDVLVDGVPVEDVTVVSDTQLVFTAPPGPAFARPTIEVRNVNGAASKPRAFRYSPGPNGGLLLFSRFGAFATFYDPVTQTSFSIPRLPTGTTNLTTVVADARGDLWGVERSRRIGRIDFRTQTLIDPVSISQLFPALVRVGATWYGLERIQRRFGAFDPVSGTFSVKGTQLLPCCGSYGIAFDGATLWYTSRVGGGINLTPISMETGEPGVPLPIQNPAGLHFEELRYYKGLFYAPSSDETLRAIDPVTGATTIVPVAAGRCNAMEVVE
ncbi:MAG: IPT/TIG domain-containing protein [Myxococcales bacterium]|nr:IPT/TIG domain-containing protein [Myxococcales bacterium]